MNRFQQITHNKKLISIIDLSNAKPQEQFETLEFAQKKIAMMPPKSALLLTDVENTQYTKEISSAMSDFAKNNTPFVKASATVGAEKILGVARANISVKAKRDINNFSNRNQAMDWLSTQP
jgi:hypothetical protein